MISDHKLVKRAESIVKAHKVEDVDDATLGSLMATYKSRRDGGASDMAILGHARAVVRRAERVGLDKPAPAKKAAPAKKTAAKKAPAKRAASGRRKSS